MGVGLVGFGIGGGFGGGGILNAASNNEGSGGASFASQIKKYRKLTQQQPTNVGRVGKADRRRCCTKPAKRVTQNGVTTKGKELFTAGLPGVGQLPGAEPAQAELRTGTADGHGLQRRRPQRTGAGGAGRCRSSSPRVQRARRCTRRWRSTPTRPRTRASATSPRKRRSASRPPPNARGSRGNWPKSRRTRAAKRPTRRRPTAKPTWSKRPPTAPSREPSSTPTPAGPRARDDEEIAVPASSERSRSSRARALRRRRLG